MPKRARSQDSSLLKEGAFSIDDMQDATQQHNVPSDSLLVGRAKAGEDPCSLQIGTTDIIQEVARVLRDTALSKDLESVSLGLVERFRQKVPDADQWANIDIEKAFALVGICQNTRPSKVSQHDDIRIKRCRTIDQGDPKDKGNVGEELHASGAMEKSSRLATIAEKIRRPDNSSADALGKSESRESLALEKAFGPKYTPSSVSRTRPPGSKKHQSRLEAIARQTKPGLQQSESLVGEPLKVTIVMMQYYEQSEAGLQTDCHGAYVTFELAKNAAAKKLDCPFFENRELRVWGTTTEQPQHEEPLLAESGKPKDYSRVDVFFEETKVHTSYRGVIRITEDGWRLK